MNTRSIGTSFLKIAATLCFLVALVLLTPTKAHAQSGTDYGWYPGFMSGHGACWVGPSGGVRCASAMDACISTAYAYSATPPYTYLVGNGPAHPDLIGDYNPGISCAWQYLSDKFVGGLFELLPPGTIGDPYPFTGFSPANGAQTPTQIGGTGSDGSVSNSGNNFVSDPINVPTGNLGYHHTDYTTSGQNALGFTRYYNSRGAYVGTLGVNWRSTYDRSITVFSAAASWVAAQRADGQVIIFTQVGSVWTPDADVDYTLTNSGSTWTLTDPDDTVETYTTTTSGYAAGYFAQLNTIKARNGFTQTLTYNGNGLLGSVSDSYGRSLTLTYNSAGTLNTVATPDSTTITYGYTLASDGQNLTSVTYPTSPAQTITYVYANVSLPSALTGVIDEVGNTYLTWTYDAYGRALTGKVGTGSNATITTIAYNDTTAGRTVTNSLGVTDTYSYSTLQNAQKVTQISRAATGTTAAATETFSYDSNGYLASKTDWNGNQTTYVNNAHGLPTTINEAVGSTVARTTTTVYDPTFVHLPDSITTPGVTTSFTYDGSGNALTRKLTDTTTTNVPYSTNGQTRTWTFTYDATGHPLTAKTPNNKTTTFTYDSSGALTSITDALTHATHITAHTGGGQPLTVTDPNSVTTTLTHDQRQRLLSSSVNTSAGARTTTYTYYLNGNVTTTQPDGSLLLSLVDSAHRLIAYADYYNNQIDWTLDANGDPVARTLFTPTGTATFYRLATFDALGRQLTDKSTTTGQSWVYTYDKDGNRLTTKDPLTHTTTRIFDALNRLSKSTDANSGVVQFTYDAHDRPLTVNDPNTHVTSYVYDGFGDRIQQTSPDSGTTIYHFDSDGNLTSKTDAASVVTNYTYDALDRVLTTTYPADSTLNVAYTYDQTGTGFTFGIGRLTSLMDAAGSLTHTYDERGNLLAEKRTHGTTVLTTSYTYDAASRVASITHPSGAVSSYTRDMSGNVTQMPFTATHSDQAYSLFSVTHLPFGPVNYINYNNGDLANFGHDQDYRMTTLAYDNYLSVPYFKWTYAYDFADDVSSVTDAITSANSQTFGYDVLNRLTSASSSGTYGSLSWTYDKNGNLSTRVAGGLTFTNSYTSGTNRISGTTWTGNSQSYGYTATGNVNTIALNSTNIFTGTYSKANRLASAAVSPLAISAIVYDWQGRRFSKQDSGGTPALYSYDQDGNLIEETDNGIVTDYLYMDGVNVANWSPGEQHLYAINFDRLGVPLVGRDEYGLTNWAAYSQPYSAMTVTQTTGIFTGPLTQNLRLPGQFFDPETAFHYNGARDYMPNLGRYSEADPIGLGGGLNLYLYANANPLKYRDRTGLEPSNDDSQASPLARANQIIAPAIMGDLLHPSRESPLSLLTAGEEILTTAGADVVAAAAYNDFLPGGRQQADTYFDSGIRGKLLTWKFDLSPIRQTPPPPISFQQWQQLYDPAVRQ